MASVPELRTAGVLLRAHTEADLPGIVEQCQDPDMQRFTTVPVPYGPDDAASFLDHVAQSWREGTIASFAIEVDHRFAGTVDLRLGEGWAGIGYGLHPWARGRGIMTAAVALVLDWGFAQRLDGWFGSLLAEEWRARSGLPR